MEDETNLSGPRMGGSPSRVTANVQGMSSKSTQDRIKPRKKGDALFYLQSMKDRLQGGGNLDES
jgi:hypothetical protein